MKVWRIVLRREAAIGGVAEEEDGHDSTDEVLATCDAPSLPPVFSPPLAASLVRDQRGRQRCGATVKYGSTLAKCEASHIACAGSRLVQMDRSPKGGA